jgi:hypothetical protein
MLFLYPACQSIKFNLCTCYQIMAIALHSADSKVSKGLVYIVLVSSWRMSVRGEPSQSSHTFREPTSQIIDL